MIKAFLEKNKEDFKRWLVDKEQGRVDLKVLPYLQDIEKGFFVEAGALDGLFMSNTKILEDLGWNGLLIEPSHNAVLKCKENRKATVEECALVSSDCIGHIVMGDFSYDGEGGLGAWSSINRKHYGGQLVPVRARTLEEVFDSYGVSKIDFLSLDVEGYELEVLKGIDFKKVDISLILVEVNLRQYSLEQMDGYLKEFGYNNLGCLSNFSYESNPGWDGTHQDYLYGKSA